MEGHDEIFNKIKFSSFLFAICLQKLVINSHIGARLSSSMVIISKKKKSSNKSGYKFFFYFETKSYS